MPQNPIDIILEQFKQLNTQMRIEFIDKCLHEAGCMDIQNASEALQKDRRTIYQQKKTSSIQ